MKHAWFVTGTDTEVGKTFCSAALLAALSARGLSALGMKPVAAGTGPDGCNEDVETLRAASSRQLSVEAVCPYLLPSPIAPHLAAAEAGVALRLPVILEAFAALRQHADALVVEGVGGFRVPLSEEFDSADLAVALNLPVILVVGMRLGCINHALLTAEAVLSRGLPLAGWIANSIDPAMLRPEANLETLRRRLPAPLLGVVPWQADRNPALAATRLDGMPTLLTAV